MSKAKTKEITYSNYILKYKKKFRKSLLTTSVCGMTGIIIAILFYFCKNVFSSTTISNVYTDEIFYYINMPLSFISRIFPFSIAELLLYAIIIFFIFSLSKTLFFTVKIALAYHSSKADGNLIKIHHCFMPIACFSFNTASVCCLLISIFILFGGINYTGLTYAERAGYTLSPSSSNDLRNLCIYLGSQVSEARNNLKLNFDNTIDENYPGYNPYNLADEALVAYDNLPDYYHITRKNYPGVKFALNSHFMSNIHITGIYPYIFPEAIVNINTPIMTLPHTICHEMAHQRGFAREDEANFIAFLACIHSENPLMRYSGYYVAFSHAMDQLYTYDNDSWNTIFKTINSGVILDIKKEAAYWDQFQTISSELTTNINDAYLSSMNIEDGVKSYGRMVDLLIAEAKISGLI